MGLISAIASLREGVLAEALDEEALPLFVLGMAASKLSNVSINQAKRCRFRSVVRANTDSDLSSRLELNGIERALPPSMARGRGCTHAYARLRVSTHTAALRLDMMITSPRRMGPWGRCQASRWLSRFTRKRRTLSCPMLCRRMRVGNRSGPRCGCGAQRP